MPASAAAPFLVKISNCSWRAEMRWRGVVLAADLRSGVSLAQLGSVLAAAGSAGGARINPASCARKKSGKFQTAARALKCSGKGYSGVLISDPVSD